MEIDTLLAIARYEQLARENALREVGKYLEENGDSLDLRNALLSGDMPIKPSVRPGER